jgi:branched-chain amino acid transport system substrate-binding protein
VGDSLLKVAGNTLDGSFFSSHFSAEDKAPATQEFVKKYKGRFGDVPDDMAALGYDSAMILADAIKRAGSTDGAKLRDAIAATKEFKGITGVITIDDRRNASKSAVIMTIENGAMKFLQTVAP